MTMSTMHTDSLLGNRPAPYLLLFVLLMAVVLAPFMLCSPLPLADYPNHLARMYILANLPSSPVLAQYYSAEWSLIPNLAMDILVPMLMPALSAEAATELFTASALFLVASGAIMLNRKLFGRWSLLPFAVFLVLYNRHFIWGFLNYLFSVGLALWFVVAWLYLRERSAVLRVIVFSSLATILLVAHLHAFGSYALIVGGYELSVAWQARRESDRLPWGNLAVGVAQFVLPVALFLLFSRTAGKAGEIVFGSPMDKAVALLDIFNNYSLPLDVATFGALALIVAWGVWKAGLRLHAHVVLPLALLFVAYLCMPNAMFNSYGADRRLLVMVAVFAIAGAGGFTVTRRLGWGLAAGLALLFGVRMAVIGQNWRMADVRYREVLAAVDMLRPGSRVAVANGGNMYPFLQNPPLDHVANLAVVRKQVFINSLFAEPGQQVLRIKYATDTKFYRSHSQVYRRGLGGQSQDGLMDPYRDIPLDRFDYVLLINRQFFVPNPPQGLSPIFTQGGVVLYAVGPRN